MLPQRQQQLGSRKHRTPPLESYCLTRTSPVAAVGSRPGIAPAITFAAGSGAVYFPACAAESLERCGSLTAYNKFCRSGFACCACEAWLFDGNGGGRRRTTPAARRQRTNCWKSFQSHFQEVLYSWLQSQVTSVCLTWVRHLLHTLLPNTAACLCSFICCSLAVISSGINNTSVKSVFVSPNVCVWLGAWSEPVRWTCQQVCALVTPGGESGLLQVSPHSWPGRQTNTVYSQI